jgi:type IV pilus assembly protein PilM
VATRIVGLDIGSRNIRALVMETGFRTFELLEAFEERVIEVADGDEEDTVEGGSPPPPPTSEADSETAESADEDDDDEEARPPILTPGQLDALTRLHNRGVFEVDRIYTNFPEAFIYFTEISLPFSDEKEIDAVLAPQLDGRLPVDVEELLLDFMNLGESADGQNLIYAGGAKHRDIAEYLDILQSRDIDPRVFDVSPIHLWTAARFLTGTRTEAVAFVDFGAENTRVLVYRGERLELSRTIHDGGELITRRLAEGFDLSYSQARKAKHEQVHLLAEEESNDADAIRAAEVAREALRPIVREVRRTLQSHAHGHDEPVERVYIGGGASELSGLEEWLRQNIDLEIRRVPFEKPMFAAIPDFETLGGRFVGALGLALRGTSVEPASQFNLRKGPYEFRGNYAFIAERSRSLAWMAALLLFALIFYFVGRSTLMKNEYEAVQAGLATATQQTFGTPIRDPEQVMARLQRGTSNTSIMPKSSAFDVMIDVGNAIVATQDAQFGAEMKSLEVNMQRATARVGGTCESAEAADVLATNLEETRCLRDVNRTSLSENRGGSGFEFAFQAEVRCSPNATDDEDDS